jgi:hypothetical protein
VRSMRKATVFGLVAVLSFSAIAGAHDEAPDGGLHPIQQGSWAHQHGEADGHLPPVQRNVQLIGYLDLFVDEERPGRISDVAAFGNYAYLGAFREPDCEDGGVYVVDISDPTSPQEVGFIPASPFTYVGEGVQVFDISTAFFEGQILLHNNENCLPIDGAIPGGRGGASMWDVTDPLNPVLLFEHMGDTDPAFTGNIPHTSIPHQSHSAFGWQQGDRAYVVMVDNAELGTTDVDIFDITNPRAPVMVLETGLVDFPQIQEDPPPNGNNVFLHDMVVKQFGDQFLMLLSYWDGGYVVLDVTNLPERPTVVGWTNFGPVEPFAAQMGLPDDWTPEGNAHYAEFSHDGRFILAADEDFGAFRIAGTIDTGIHAGDTFSATQGSDVPQVDEDSPLSGGTTWVGDACTPVAPALAPNQIALIERGTCTFTHKLTMVQTAGYAAGIVFNDQLTDANCDAQVFMLAIGDIPFMFVGRSAGLKILGLTFEDPCATPSPLPGAPSEDVSILAIFDGWGYVHLYDAKTFKVIDHWALPEAIDPAFARGFGILSVHEVATDPRRNRAYVSHYSGGFRVLDFNRGGIKEVGAYIHPDGNNFWGVEVHYMPDATDPIVLASDRDSGLWIFRYAAGKKGRP